MSLINKGYGIYSVNIKDFPDYPIAYLRLCYNFYIDDYCIAKDCDSSEKYDLRSFIVVGMRIGSQIFEQSFYLSTGLNSIESMESFFDIKLNSTITDLWIPFTGLGYSDVTGHDLKIVKSNFNCLKKSKDCLYGRFGNVAPNLMQISYCLGGSFWTNNIDLINKQGYNIKEYPMINKDIENLPCSFIYKGGNGYKKDIYSCALYINNYIGSAMALNYQTDFSGKANILRFSKEFINVKADFRIFAILYNFNNNFFSNAYYNYLPVESRFPPYPFWPIYYSALRDLKKADPKYFDTYVTPIINEKIPNTEINITSAEYNKWIQEPEYKISLTPPEIIEPILIEKSTSSSIPIKYTLGSENNPHSSRKYAEIGDYYKHGDKIQQRRK